MKTYPEKKDKVKPISFKGLSPLERTTRKVALGITFISVFIFFFKILFL